MVASATASQDPCNTILMKRAAPAKMSSGSMAEVQVSFGPSMSTVQFGAAINFPAMPSKLFTGCLVVFLVGNLVGVDGGVGGWKGEKRRMDEFVFHERG